AVVLHHEFASSSVDEATRQQLINQKKFVEAHPELKSHHRFESSNILSARMHGMNARRVLFIDDRIPHHYLGSGFPRANAIIHDLIRNGRELTLFPTDQRLEDWSAVYADVSAEVEIIMGLHPDQIRSFILDRKGFYDVIFVSRPQNMARIQRLQKEMPDIF